MGLSNRRSWYNNIFLSLSSDATETVGSNSTETHTITKRSAIATADVDASDVAEEEEDIEDDYVKGLKGDAKCRTKFWRCVAKVAKGSVHYMQEPGGISG